MRWCSASTATTSAAVCSSGSSRSAAPLRRDRRPRRRSCARPDRARVRPAPTGCRLPTSTGEVITGSPPAAVRNHVSSLGSNWPFGAAGRGHPAGEVGDLDQVVVARASCPDASASARTAGLARSADACCGDDRQVLLPFRHEAPPGAAQPTGRSARSAVSADVVRLDDAVLGQQDGQGDRSRATTR